jgi:deazaflavin-dependent oxidoreductase (nitroreductase family)
MSSFNDQVIAEFRANAGMVGGHFEGKHLLLLHTIGRRTGQERVIPLVYTTVGDSYVVAGSQGGAEKDPLWVANVEAMPEITIERRTRRVLARFPRLRDQDCPSIPGHPPGPAGVTCPDCPRTRSEYFPRIVGGK